MRPFVSLAPLMSLFYSAVLHVAVVDAQDRSVFNPDNGQTTTFIELASENNDAQTVLEFKVPPGGGIDLHIHKKHTETFVAVNGTLLLNGPGGSIFCPEPEPEVTLEPGQEELVETGRVHDYENPSETDFITFRTIFKPGNRGLEQAIQINAGLANDGLDASIFEQAVLLNLSDLNPLIGAAKLVKPLFSAVGCICSLTGTEADLIDRYVVF